MAGSEYNMEGSEHNRIDVFQLCLICLKVLHVLSLFYKTVITYVVSKQSVS